MIAHVYIRNSDNLFLKSVVGFFHLVELEDDKSNGNKSRGGENSADKAPTMETSTGR